jgi:hypothetical protein
MCENCGCKIASRPIQYKCQCKEEACSCSIIEFEKEPKSIPYCCGLPMKRGK